MRKIDTEFTAGIIIIIVLLLTGITTTVVKYNNQNEYDVTVIKTEVKRSKNSDSDDKYLIYCKTDDGETKVFENTDALLIGKFNSSDIYAKIEKDKKYKIKVYGYRFPFLSWYENIISVEEIETV